MRGGDVLVSGDRLGAALGATAFYREVLGAAEAWPMPAPWNITGVDALAGLTAFGETGPAEALQPASSASRVLARYGDASAAALQAGRLIYLGFDVSTLPIETQRAWLARLLPLLQAWPPARLEAEVWPQVSAFVPGEPFQAHLTLYNDSLWTVSDLAVTVTVPTGVVVLAQGGAVQTAQVLRWPALAVGPDEALSVNWLSLIPSDWSEVVWDVVAHWAGLAEPVHLTVSTPVRLILPRVWVPLVAKSRP